RYFDNDTGCPQAFLNHCIEQDTHSHFFEIYGNRELAIGLLCLLQMCRAGAELVRVA
ncbi:MAG: hypothetical protein ACI9UA_003279, partial [Pseudoalteromonas tetraodonis]